VLAIAVNDARGIVQRRCIDAAAEPMDESRPSARRAVRQPRDGAMLLNHGGSVLDLG
jgi:hypothetical protein